MVNIQALHNTELLATYASIDKRVQVLGYVLKEFAKVITKHNIIMSISFLIL